MTDSDRPDLSHLDGEERVQAEQLLEMAGLREFDQELPSALGDAERNGTMLSLFALDIAELILINDEHGHAAGDRVLARTAQVLVDTLAEKGNVYRVGGDEFWAIVPELPAERVEALASEAAESVAAANPEYTVNVSFASATVADRESEQALRARLSESLRRVAVQSKQARLREAGQHWFADQLDRIL